jgi:uncharacterized protein (TIGR01777 family)
MRILITGATGFIGRPLVKRLLEKGHRIEVFSRDSEKAAAVLPARVGVDGWQPRRGVSLAHLEPLDAVVHLAGEGVADKRWSAARKRALYGSRIDTTRALVAALRDLPAEQRPKTFVCASATGYYGDRGEELLDEQSPPGSGFLPHICVDWEKEAFAARELGVRVAAIRTGVVLGRGGGALAKMLPPFRLGAGGRLADGKQWVSWIHLDDLIELLCMAVENDQVSGPVNGVSPNAVTNAELTRELAAALKRPALFPIPAAALKLAFGEMASVLLDSVRARPAAAERLGFQFKFPDVRVALADICRDFDQELEREQWLPYPAESVFSFFSDARNLERITPPFLHFSVRSISTETMREGTTIRYRLRLHGVPIYWTSRIDDWEPNQRFVDTQTSGPYALWHHTHEFEPHDGGTIVRDRVRYRMRFGAIGDLVAGAMVRNDLERIFEYRRVQMMSLFPPTKTSWDEV